MSAQDALGAEEPLDLLMACHARIRRYLGGIEALLAFPDWSDPRAIATARDCAHYFREALPLHAEDEDASVAPRLLRLGLGPELAATLRRLADEHHAIDTGCLSVVAALDSVVAGGPRTSALQAASRPFATLLRSHLEVEERSVFVFLDRLPDAERPVIVAEIRARRAGG
ncbi:MAG TPA: hemerythrin domain-containing protein [Myxococcota bacterium]|jgi:hypothetical protein|nr:hemerythrin domain-containing protein [Myxococcota bacterium]